MISSATIERFEAAVADLMGGVVPPATRIGLAVSGGVDSVALLLLAAEAFPTAIEAASVDHGLRPEAPEECQFVARLCEERGVAHSVLVATDPITGNIQSEARKGRYALLERWRDAKGLDWIATAHHADDQFETIVMRLMRGSGVDGLSGIRPVNGHVIRPLLGFGKSELAEIVSNEGIDPVRDPSNEDEAFDRVRVRRSLAGLGEKKSVGVNRAADALREASEALDWAANKEIEQRVRASRDHLSFAPAGLPREIVRRIVLSCLDRIEPAHPPRGPALDALLDALVAGETRTLGAVLCSGGDVWTFSLAPARRHG